MHLGGWTLLLDFTGTKGSKWVLGKWQELLGTQRHVPWSAGTCIPVLGHAPAVLLSQYSSGAHDGTLLAVSRHVLERYQTESLKHTA